MPNTEDSEVSTEVAYSKALFTNINRIIKSVELSSDYANEIFLHFFLKSENVLQLSRFYSVEGVELNCKEKSHLEVLYPNKNRLVTFFHIGISWLLFVVSFFIVFFSSCFLPLFIFFFGRKRPLVGDCFAIIRSPAALSKLQFLKEIGDIVFYNDSLSRDNAESMYLIGGFFFRLLSFVIVPANSLRDLISVFNDARRLLGWKRAGYAVLYFSRRIAHKCIFQRHLELMIKLVRPAAYYTGNKEDRFALVERRICREYLISVKCIPHGLEYGFEMPGGLVGDDFYCSTSRAKERLSALYPVGQNFIYDPDIAKKMFFRGKTLGSIDKIVFFTEARGIKINQKIMSYMTELELPFFVKIHPKDSYANYSGIISQEKIVKDFNFAIANSVCLARKSTVLVEALYNNSRSIAVLIDSGDKGYANFVMPSLLDEGIQRAYSLDELSSLIKAVM